MRTWAVFRRWNSGKSWYRTAFRDVKPYRMVFASGMPADYYTTFGDVVCRMRGDNGVRHLVVLPHTERRDTKGNTR